MPPRLRLFYSLLTAGLLFIPVVALYSELSKRSDIWWTPPALAASLTESQDRVQVYVRGKPLDALLNEGKLRITEETGSHPLGASEISLRFNNWIGSASHACQFSCSTRLHAVPVRCSFLLSPPGVLRIEARRPHHESRCSRSWLVLITLSVRGFP